MRGGSTLARGKDSKGQKLEKRTLYSFKRTPKDLTLFPPPMASDSSTAFGSPLDPWVQMIVWSRPERVSPEATKPLNFPSLKTISGNRILVEVKTIERGDACPNGARREVEIST